MNASSCILFIKAGLAGLSPVPDHVETLVKSRLASQYALTHVGYQIRFDAGECTVRGTYELEAETIRLRAESLQWPGERGYAYGAILDGAALDFPSPLLDATAPALIAQAPAASARPTWIMPTVLGGLALAALSIFVARRDGGGPTSAQTNAVPRTVRHGAR